MRFGGFSSSHVYHVGTHTHTYSHTYISRPLFMIHHTEYTKPGTIRIARTCEAAGTSASDMVSVASLYRMAMPTSVAAWPVQEAF